MVDKRLRDVIMLVYAPNTFHDSWKLSLNVVYIFALKAVRNFIFSVMSTVI